MEIDIVSFFTSVRFHRPRNPPIVRGGDLESFVRAIARLGIIEESFFLGAKIAFGDAIDQDDQSAWGWRPVTEDGIIQEATEIEWSWTLGHQSLMELCEALHEVADEAVYRAWLSLGTIAAPVRKPLTREPCSQNNEGFYPSDLAFEIGRIEIHEPNHQGQVHCGWMSLNIGGPGYPFPWTRRDVLAKLIVNEPLRRATELCRNTWPVTPDKPDPKTIELRRQLTEYWLYDDFHKPWDWYWGVDGI